MNYIIAVSCGSKWLVQLRQFWSAYLSHFYLNPSLGISYLCSKPTLMNIGLFREDRRRWRWRWRWGRRSRPGRRRSRTTFRGTRRSCTSASSSSSWCRPRSDLDVLGKIKDEWGLNGACGKWQVASGKWQVASGKWHVACGSCWLQWAVFSQTKKIHSSKMRHFSSERSLAL